MDGYRFSKARSGILLGLLAGSMLLASCGGRKPPGGGSGWVPPPGTGGGGTVGRVTLAVEMGGSVTSNPDIGTCVGMAQCEFTAPIGQVITFTAVPEADYDFEEWELCPGPSGLQCVHTMTPSQTIKAEFDLRP